MKTTFDKKTNSIVNAETDEVIYTAPTGKKIIEPKANNTDRVCWTTRVKLPAPKTTKSCRCPYGNCWKCRENAVWEKAKMVKTTKGDGMEQIAERWLDDNGFISPLPNMRTKEDFKDVALLTRLLRKVARDARKQALDEIEALDPLMADICGEWEQADEIAFGVQKWLVKNVRKYSV